MCHICYNVGPVSWWETGSLHVGNDQTECTAFNKINSSPPSAAYMSVNWASFGAEQATSHYLNQCWFIVNWNPGNKFQWNLNGNSIIFYSRKCKIVVCQIGSHFAQGGNVLTHLPQGRGRCNFSYLKHSQWTADLPFQLPWNEWHRIPLINIGVIFWGVSRYKNAILLV